MASFQFVIPANSFSSGSPSSSTTIVADRGLSRTIKHRVLTAKFGDGYEQRVTDGVNSKGDTFAISINNRLASEVFDLFEESKSLEEKIKENLRRMGYEL